MLSRFYLKNFGPIDHLLDWKNLGKINLIIGNNGCGKTFLLKALYSAVRTLEDYKRGDNPDSIAEILAKKLYWTFQPEKIGDLVTKPSKTDLVFLLKLDNNQIFKYTFGKDTTKLFESSLENEVAPRAGNSIFLPAKEVLSLHHIILKSRKQYQFGFDDTYLDLAEALQISPGKDFMSASLSDLVGGPIPPPKGHGSYDFEQSCDRLEGMIGGKIDYDETANRWYFKKDGQRFSIGTTAEGVKKVAILDRLLNNGYLSENSIIFIDEPESALHPEAISKLLDIVAILAKHGIQFFLASHSYFVIKKLFLIAQEQKISIPVLSKEGDSWQQSDLLDGMPDNAIINESIRLYEEEVELAFK